MGLAPAAAPDTPDHNPETLDTPVAALAAEQG